MKTIALLTRQAGMGIVIDGKLVRVSSFDSPSNRLRRLVCPWPPDAPIMSSSGARLKRQVEVKSRALPLLALDTDLTRMQFEDSLCNRESESH